MDIEKLLRQKCPVCKKKMKIDKYEFLRATYQRRERIFCSHSCAAKYHGSGSREKMEERGLLGRKGPDNPNWRGGISPAEHTRRAREKWPEKHKARRILDAAIRRGEIVRPKICPLCNRETKICAHHKDYGKPLEVEWKCHKCHAKERIGRRLERSPIPAAA